MDTSRLTGLLKRRKITQKELSKQLKVSERGLGQMIIKKSFKVTTLEKVSEILNVPMTFWFMEDEDKAIEYIQKNGAELVFNETDGTRIYEKQLVETIRILESKIDTLEDYNSLLKQWIEKLQKEIDLKE